MRIYLAIAMHGMCACSKIGISRYEINLGLDQFDVTLKPHYIMWCVHAQEEVASTSLSWLAQLSMSLLRRPAIYLQTAASETVSLSGVDVRHPQLSSSGIGFIERIPCSDED